MEFKKKVYIVTAILAVLILLLLGVKYLEKRYMETAIAENQEVQKEYEYNSELGEKLVPCAAGGYEVYRPNKSIVVCGTVLTPEIIYVLDRLQ